MMIVEVKNVCRHKPCPAISVNKAAWNNLHENKTIALVYTATFYLIKSDKI
jgi:hypothetical protein